MGPSRLVTVVIAGWLVSLGACGDDSSPSKDAGPAVVSDAGGQAGSPAPTPAADSGPPSACIAVAAVARDGPEDCPKGQMCCGSFNGSGYDAFSCADSCVGLEAEGGTFSELCHKGQACETEGYVCSTNPVYLPTFLARCRDTGEAVGKQKSVAAGEVNCGTGVCGEDEHCCLRTPREPYCLPTAQECSCEDPVVTNPDAGGLHEDAGQGDAG